MLARACKHDRFTVSCHFFPVRGVRERARQVRAVVRGHFYAVRHVRAGVRQVRETIRGVFAGVRQVCAGVRWLILSGSKGFDLFAELCEHGFHLVHFVEWLRQFAGKVLDKAPYFANFGGKDCKCWPAKLWISDLKTGATDAVQRTFCRIKLII
jgi:hypothetical protein